MDALMSCLNLVIYYAPTRAPLSGAVDHTQGFLCVQRDTENLLLSQKRTVLVPVRIISWID
jgi:hypothetical protein